MLTFYNVFYVLSYAFCLLQPANLKISILLCGCVSPNFDVFRKNYWYIWSHQVFSGGTGFSYAQRSKQRQAKVTQKREQYETHAAAAADEEVRNKDEVVEANEFERRPESELLHARVKSGLIHGSLKEHEILFFISKKIL